MYACVQLVSPEWDWFDSVLEDPVKYVSLIISGISLVISYVTQLTTKCYVSGNIQIVKDALNPVRLNKAIEIINEALGNASNTQVVFLMSYLKDKEQYAALREVFRDLNLVCDLIGEKALPKKVLKSSRKEVVQFLSIPKVAGLVESYKDSFPAIYRLVHQSHNVSKWLWGWVRRVIGKHKLLTKSNFKRRTTNEISN